MSVAFICAMPMELTPLKRRLELEKSRIGPLDVYTGEAGSHSVVAIVTGMGTALAAERLTLLLDGAEVERVLVVGITGAIHAETDIGFLVLPVEVVNGETGQRFRPHRFGPGRPEGTLWTSDSLITDPDVLTRLRDEGVVALDMETAAIAEVCERRGVPWSVFRAVSDRVTDGVLDEEVFTLANPDGTPNLRAAASYVLRHPGRLPGLVRMMKEAKVATERAAEAAIAAMSGS